MANILTGLRMLCGILLLCFPTFSGWYYLFYLLGGFTDAIDGAVARRLGQASDFGAKFDTAADVIFAMAAVITIIGALYVPLWLMLWIGLIILIKFAGLISGYIRYHEWRVIHSALNRICGILVFLVPLFIGGDYPRQAKALAVIALCILATAAAIAEFAAIHGKDH